MIRANRTRQMLARIEGAKIILNDENKHFLLACNQASELATGEYLLFFKQRCSGARQWHRAGVADD